jgi:hypothetical protein
LLVTRVGERNVLLHRYIAERIAQEFDIAMPAELSEDDVLNFVVCRFLDDHRCRREDIYPGDPYGLHAHADHRTLSSD